MDEKERYERGMAKRRKVLGNAWVDRARISLSDLRRGAGLRVTHRSVLGLVSLDAGVDEHGHAAFYFSIGHRPRDGGP